ncbi:MAG: PP2C family protein-serine/threonine phosphatase, partial [Myxococcota bacterium]
VLSQLNQTIFEATQGTSGMTCFVATIDLDSGLMQYANGGHMFPIVAPHADRPDAHNAHPSLLDLRALATRGSPIGYQAVGHFEQRETHLRPGDRLIMYTDGVIECVGIDDNPFSKRRFLRLLARMRKTSTADIIHGIERKLTDHLGGRSLDDDFMISIIEFSGS